MLSELWQLPPEVARPSPTTKMYREISPFYGKETEALGGEPCAQGFVVGRAEWGLIPEPSLSFTVSSALTHLRFCLSLLLPDSLPSLQS